MISNRTQGFTLLELLIAMSIFSLISIMAFSGLRSVLFNKEIVDIELQRLSEIQRSILNLTRDIEQSVDRPIRDELGTTRPALSGGQNVDSTLLEFTRNGWRNPARQSRSQLQRVAYSFEDNQLIRQYWYHLDHLQDSQPVRRVLLTGVENIEVRYLDREWSSSWPSLTQQAASPALPRAIEITFELKGWGKISRLFRIRT
ncbi:MAG: type II secretion system minor pseudopilin GspJ [Gammaproteobacteria bacterium]|nr:type II secretion system minor pseudopilin GspJ [Gammaproteobacteria bacterium]